MMTIIILILMMMVMVVVVMTMEKGVCVFTECDYHHTLLKLY